MTTGIALCFMKTLQALWRWGSPEFKQQVAQWNKRWTNPVTMTLLLAGRPHSPYAVVQHVGRRSGHAYVTPVVIAPISGGFLIPVAYGEWADWVRNILAARTAVIAWQGRWYHVGQPTLIDAPVVPSQFPCFWRRSLRRHQITRYLRVLITPMAQEADGLPVAQQDADPARRHS